MKAARTPLTGTVTIEWTDAADPDDGAAEASFGWSIRAEPQMDDERLSALLREIADVL